MSCTNREAAGKREFFKQTMNKYAKENETTFE